MNTVLYDQDCMLCRTLAAWGERRADGALAFQSWQSYYGPDDEGVVSLRVLTPEGPRDDADAWEFLLTHLPDFAAVNWIAEKLGLKPQVVGAMQRAGSVARRFCRNCVRFSTERVARRRE